MTDQELQQIDRLVKSADNWLNKCWNSFAQKKPLQEGGKFLPTDGFCRELRKGYKVYYNCAGHLLHAGEIEKGLAVMAKAKKTIIMEVQASWRQKMNIEKLIETADDMCVSFKELDRYYLCLLLESPFVLDSYLIYLEKNRLKKDRFYLPRRQQLLKLGIIQGLQDLEDDKIDILSISMPPGTGKTTIEKFFVSWVIGRHPDDYNIFFSHSADITNMFYRSVLDITTNEAEYQWKNIFDQVPLESTNAKSQNINFSRYKPFASLQCSSVGSMNAGKIRASRYIFVDDMIGGIEQALNKNTLDKLWRIYSTDFRQRKLNEQVKELHLATRWSVHDVIGRLQRLYEGSDRCRFISIPDINPETGKSNFDYKVNGMSVEFFKAQEEAMDDISYRCLYKNEPIEREGLLYHLDELRRFLERPVEEPDAIIGVCDTKSKGSDFMVLPVVYQYGDDYYIEDCICSDSSDFGVQYERIAQTILQHNMQQVEFESNAGGDRIAFEVEKKVSEAGGRCNITTKPTETNKETRIIVNSDWVKKHMLFKDQSMYTAKSDYGIMVSWLLAYSVVGKNVHDDVPDALANFALFVTKKNRIREPYIIHNVF